MPYGGFKVHRVERAGKTVRGSNSQSSSQLGESVSINREIKAENELALDYSGMGRYHKQQGNVQEARKYLTDALVIFERLGHLTEPAKVRNELAELPATDGSRSVRHGRPRENTRPLS